MSEEADTGVGIDTAAQAARERMMAQLKVCTCRYPVVRFRNGSGHSGGCPAHTLWREQRAARRPVDEG